MVTVEPDWVAPVGEAAMAIAVPVALRTMVPKVRPTVAGSALIFPRLWKATAPVVMTPAAPVTVRLAPSVRAAPAWSIPLPVWAPNRMVPGKLATPSMVWGWRRRRTAGRG